jgi:5-methylcytosine-specific restriction endonuclease McrA
VPWVNRLDRAIDREWKKRRRTSSREQVAAEVLARANGEGGDNQIDGILVVDINAYRRGHAHDGEPCHLIGGGPIPVDVAREMMNDAFLKVVMHDGVNVHTVKHFGRHRPAILQTVLDIGPAPEFAGASCKECGRKYNLQWDHIDPVANNGPTTFANLQGLCIPDHVPKTERDRKAGKLKRRPQGP